MDKISIAQMKFYPVGYVNTILAVHRKKPVEAPVYPREVKIPAGHFSEEDALQAFLDRGIEAVLYKAQ
jgi:hypothetical protein